MFKRMREKKRDRVSYRQIHRQTRRHLGRHTDRHKQRDIDRQSVIYNLLNQDFPMVYMYATSLFVYEYRQYL